MDEVGDFPIGMEEAKEIRLKLMEERKAYVVRCIQIWHPSEVLRFPSYSSI